MRSWWLALAIVLSAACGDDSPAHPDGGVDATPDSARTRIEVDVMFADGTPAPNIDVVFHDAAGLPMMNTTTDASGVASIDTFNVAMVTVLGRDETTPSRETFTWVGVKDGDKLKHYLGYGGADTPPDDPFTATLDVTLPPNPPANATTYSFDVMCEGSSSSSTSFTYTMSNDCRRPGSNAIDVVVIAKSSTSANLAFAVMPNITLAATGSTTVDFSGGWRTDWLDFAVSYTNTPAGATSIRTFMNLEVAGQGYHPFSSQPGTVTQGSTTQRSYQFVNGFASAFRYSFDLYYGETAPRPMTFYGKQIASGTSATLDMSAALLPAVTSTAIEDGTTVRPKLTWTQAGTHERGSAGFASVSWDAPEQGSWTVLFPPAMQGTSITIPALPDSLAAYRPPTDGSVGAMPPLVQFGYMSYLPTYDEFRQVGDLDRGSTYEEIFTMYPGF